MALGIGIVTFVPDYTRTVVEREIDRAVQAHTRSAAQDFARSLHDDWSDLIYLAEQVGTQPASVTRAMLTGMVGSGNRVAWAGLAGLDGRVSVASNAVLEGEDVSGQPWFPAGLRGGFAGDVHEAVLFNQLLGGEADNPIRFIDFALPVRDARGNAEGVLAIKIAFSWAETFLRDIARVREMDLFLVSASGEVLFGTAPLPSTRPNLDVIRAAASGTAGLRREVWPDGDTYFAAAVPSVRYDDLPSFGWRLVGRLPADAFEADRQQLLGALWLLVAGAMVAFSAAAVLFSQVFVTPIAQLAQAAERIARGEPVYPPESRTSAEAVALSAALARIQSRLGVTPVEAADRSSSGVERQPSGKAGHQLA